MQDQLDRIEAKVDKLSQYVWLGNGKPPLTVRMDRIEQAESKRVWWNRTWATAAIGAVVVSLWNLLSRGHHS